ncbi:MAG: HAD hydrolase family protein [Planctomycetota bacterium]
MSESDTAVVVVAGMGSARMLAGRSAARWVVDAAVEWAGAERVWVWSDRGEFPDDVVASGVGLVAPASWRPNHEEASPYDSALRAWAEQGGPAVLGPDGSSEIGGIVLLDGNLPLIEAEDFDAVVSAVRSSSGGLVMGGRPTGNWVWVDGVRQGGRHRCVVGPPRIFGLDWTRYRAMSDPSVWSAEPVGFSKESQWAVEDEIDCAAAEAVLRARQAADRGACLPERVEVVVFDFDGVFTDNKVTLTEEGLESARCSRGDGMGIDRLRAAGVPMLILSKEPVPIVMHRAKKLKLECLHGIDDKLPALKAWLGERGYSLAGTVYLGNDVNDYACLQAVGCGVVVADAVPGVLPVADMVLANKGGDGAVRELCELILERRGDAGEAG